MDTLRHEYKNLKLKEGKSDSGSINWPDSLKRLDRILGSNPKTAGLDGARDGGKKAPKLGQDLNKDPPELVNEKKKEEKQEDGVTGQAINKPKKDFNDGTLKPFEKAYLEQNQKALDTLFKLEMDRMELDRGRQKLQEALIAAIVETKEKGKKLEDEDNSGSVKIKKRKKPEDEDISGNEARDPDESDAT